MEKNEVSCVYCGIYVDIEKSWPHVDGDSNLGVKKIEYFCSPDHKMKFFSS